MAHQGDIIKNAINDTAKTVHTKTLQEDSFSNMGCSLKHLSTALQWVQLKSVPCSLFFD